MAKKKTAHKKHVENAVKEEKTQSEKPLIEMNKSTAITAVIFLLVGLLVGALLISVVNTNAGVVSDNSSDSSQLKQKITTYLNENFRDPDMVLEGMEFTLEDSNSLSSDTFGYEVLINVDGLMQPAGAIVYASGENFVIASSYPINVNDKPEVPTDSTENQTQQPVTTSELTAEQQEEILSFNSCLAEKGIVVYGANWCGYTKALVENLGGFNLISPVYVECTENEELCAMEQISGYPTIKLNGEKINIDRTFSGFAGATGCALPNISQDAVTTTAGSC